MFGIYQLIHIIKSTKCKIMQKKNGIILLLGVGLTFFISCSNNKSSSPSNSDTTTNSNNGLTPSGDQPSGSTYNPNQSPQETVNPKKDSTRKKQ